MNELRRNAIAPKFGTWQRNQPLPIMTKDDIQNLVAQFEKKRSANHRYASFDYCFNYFRSFKENNHLPDLATKENVEKSCLHLGFYLASWGMFRMSGKLGQEASAKHFKNLIDAISKNECPFAEAWDIDASDYRKNPTRILLQNCFKKISGLVMQKSQKQDRTLVTKIMLGIFGCVPAFDGFFTKTFKALYKEQGCAFTAFNDAALLKLDDFYKNHADIIAELGKETKTLDFETGNFTDRCYKQAKIIDMIGFQKGKNDADEK
jgi:hypothetical protein